ncbi:MAG: preprotein translocase subunit SecG [Polyangia bacterium]
MYTFLTVLHVIVCIFLMLVVLLQAGRGGGMGIAFGGSGGSQSVFGSSGGANFLTKMTAVCAFIFFANSMTLAYMSSQSDSRRLQKIAAKKAAEKKAEDATKTKLAGALEKAREEAEKAKSVPPEGATASGSATATETTTEEKPVVPAKAAVEMAVPAKTTLKLKLPASDTAAPADKPAPVKKVRVAKPASTAEAAPGEKPAAAEEATPPQKPVRIKKATPPEEEAPVAPTPAQP